jgi:branched-chain amino acid transport system substrate-binding protein
MIFETRISDLQIGNSAGDPMKESRFILFFLFIFFLVSPTHSEEAIDIAAIYALTGAAAETNAYAFRGVGYAVEEVNKQAEISGKKINLLVPDNQSTISGSTAAAKRAVTANVVAIAGRDWSSHSIAVAHVAQAREIPMIAGLSTHPKVTQFRNCFFRS